MVSSVAANLPLSSRLHHRGISQRNLWQRCVRWEEEGCLRLDHYDTVLPAESNSVGCLLKSVRSSQLQDVQE